MERINGEWSKVGEAIYGKADAQKVTDEILSIGDEATPDQIIEKAKDENSELHKCFDWNDTEAAAKWRLHQARNIVGCLIIRREKVEENTPEIRVFHKVENGVGYRPATYVFTRSDEHAKLLQRAYAELQAFKRKYSNLQELDYILRLIA